MPTSRGSFTPVPPKKNSGWCTPLIIYIVFVVIGIVSTLFTKDTIDQKISNVMLSLVWSGFWGVIMYEMCRRGHRTWAWIILFAPMLITLILLFIGTVIPGAF